MKNYRMFMFFNLLSVQCQLKAYLPCENKCRSLEAMREYLFFMEGIIMVMGKK